MNIKKYYLKSLTMLLIFLSINFLFGNTGRYTRKSIAFVDAILYKDKAKNLPLEHEQYLLKTIHRGVKIERFDFNPLPEKVQKNFRQELKNQRTVTKVKISEIIDATILPEIIKVLDVKKEIRARNLVSESQTNAFIATKAHEIGITARQLEQVMNSSYIYVPFVSKYKISNDSKEKKISVTIESGLIWYHVITTDNPEVKKLATLSTSVSSSVEYEKNNTKKAIREAIHNIAPMIAKNLEIHTRELDMFKLQTPIAEVDNRTIHFPLGKFEGIKMDEPFFVGEFMEDNSGKTKFVNSGFVRIGKVADNRQQGQHLSSAWAIHKGDWVSGMTMVEHPRLGVDVAFKPRMINVDITQGGLFSDKDDKAFIVAFDEFSGTIPALDLSLNWNIAPLTKKRQSFLVIGGTGGIVPVDNYVVTEQEIFNFFDIFTIDIANEQQNSFATYFNGYLGYMKKYYFGPFALHWEAVGGIQGLSASGELDGDNISIINGSFGGRLGLGLEYAVNIDWNIGIFTGYTFFPSIDYWYVEYDDDEETISTFYDQDYPEISSIGETFGLYIHFSPPTLPFNPGNFINK